MQFFNKLKLRGKLALLLTGFGLIPIVVLGSIVFAGHAKMKERSMLNLESVAFAVSEKLDRNLFERYGVMPPVKSSENKRGI